MSKILFLDIETAPNQGYTWGKWEQNVIDFSQEWSMLSWAGKWSDSKVTVVKALDDFKGYKKGDLNDKNLLAALWPLLDSAEIVCGHNLDQFDVRKINARFLYHGITPPSPYKTIDTKKVAKKYFALNSNKLDDIGKHLGVGEKIHVGFGVWLGCLRGDPKSWTSMKKYNKMDVLLLERVYFKLRPWISLHSAVDFNNFACPKCGGIGLQKRGVYRNKTTEYVRLYCADCGGWARERKMISNSGAKVISL